MQHRSASFLIAAAACCLARSAFPIQEALAGEQPVFATADSAASQDSQDPSARNSSRERFPPSPGGEFFRGNDRNDPQQAGYYLSMGRFVPILCLYFFWTWGSHWIAADGRRRRRRVEGWNTFVLVCGFAGLLASLCVPFYALGILVLLLASAGPFSLYVMQRNNAAPQPGQGFTLGPLWKFASRRLKRFQVRVNSPSRPDDFDSSLRFIPAARAGGGFEGRRSRQAESSTRYLAAKELVYDAVLRGTTDIHLEPRDDEVTVRLRIDGMIYPTDPFERSVGEGVINVFKNFGGMDIIEKRRPQSGSFAAQLKGREIDIRASTQPTRTGEKLSLRILDRANSVSSMANLGLRKPLQDTLYHIVHRQNGLLLCCGPTGAGKSTTLYATLSEVDPYQKNIITVEDPIEFRMDNVTQIEVDRKRDQTFDSLLKSVLRQDPDVVMVGEMNDAETARTGCQASTTGHMVFSTVHANDAVTALFRLIDLGVEPYLVANSVTAVLGQRLVRRLCGQCKVPYKPKVEFLRQAGLPPEKIACFFRPPPASGQPCAACSGLGFRGRVGLFELLVVSDPMRDLVRQRAPLATVRGEARKGGMRSLKEEGLLLVAAGVTSVDELLRVIQ